MDSSKRVERVSGGKQVSYAQRHRFRCLSAEQAMAYEDSYRPSIRYTGIIKATEPEPRRRTQPRRIRDKAGIGED